MKNPKKISKSVSIGTLADLDALRARLRSARGHTCRQLHQLTASADAFAIISKMRFGKTGCDPLDPQRPLNLIEQLNQTSTILASLRATEYLLRAHPDPAPLKLNLGAATGWDIESERNGGVIAEVFAAVEPTSNDKLRMDVEKVAAARAKHKYVFFMCPGYEAGERPRRPEHPDVAVFSVGLEDA